MKNILNKYFDGAKLWQVALWSAAWAAMFLALLLKI